MLVPEDAEDVEHRDARIVLARPFRPDDHQQVVECGLELVAGGERLGEVDPGLVVGGIRRDARFEAAEIFRARGLEPGGRLEPLDLGVGDEAPEHDERLVGRPTVDEHRGEARPRLGVVGLLVQDLAQNVLRGRRVVGQQCRPGLVDHQVELCREDPLDPFADGRLRDRAGEHVDDLAVAEGDHHRDALDAVLGGELLVRVDIDLDELEGAAGFSSEPLEDRADDAARLAPGRPEVHDDRDLAAALENVPGESGGVDILDEVTRGGHRGQITEGSPATVAAMEHRPEAPFGQVLTAVITPFGEDGAIDYGTFWRLTRHLAGHGSDGIVVGGTTGESPTLSKVEKVALFKAAVDAVGDRMTVIAGTGTYDTRESVELTERAAESGVHGVMAVTPYYSKPPQEGLFQHFTAIAEATDLPVLLYNIPGRTCRLIEVETLVRLANHPRIVAVKDAVDDIEFTRGEIGALPDGFAVYSGSDGHTLDIVRAGGVGVVSVTAHLAGPQIKALVQAAVSGDDEEADRLDRLLKPLNEALFLEPNPMPLKVGLDMAWDPVGVPRLPLIPASDETREAIRSALVALNET